MSYQKQLLEKLEQLTQKNERGGMKDKLTASEAIYGFCGWLASRKEKTLISTNDDCAVIADLINQFCKENKLNEPRDGWKLNLISPSGECSGAAA